jgi:hypothetical protein
VSCTASASWRSVARRIPGGDADGSDAEEEEDDYPYREAVTVLPAIDAIKLESKVPVAGVCVRDIVLTAACSCLTLRALWMRR